MPSLSKAAGHIVQSDIRTMSVECDKVRGINLAQGICDTEVPLPVRQRAQQAIEEGLNSYTRLDGIGALRAAIAGKMQEYNHVACDPEREVLVTAGATGAFYSACQALLDPGDEVIVFEPYYGYHVNTLAAQKLQPVYVALQPPDWRFSREELDLAITPRTRAILVNSPANPSGKVFGRQELEWIADCATRHDLFVLTDEIYEYFLYDGRQHISPASLPGMAERTITISGFSKTFSVTGWRIGYAICSPRWAPSIGYFHDLAYICAPSPFQHAAAAGLNELQPEFYDDLAKEYAYKRDLLCNSLQDAGLIPSIPQGAYYVLADSSRLAGRTSKEKAMGLLAATGVAAVPGASFFRDHSGDNFLRFCFAKTNADLQAACERLQRLKLAAVSR